MYSVSDVTQFLEYAGEKGLLNKSTARAKLIAVERVFSAADEHERNDIDSVNMDSLMNRFVNLEGSAFKPESLAAYQSRVRSAIDEFKAWKADPMSFRPLRRSGAKKNAQPKAREDKRSSSGSAQRDQTFQPQLQQQVSGSFPIPLRENLVVYVQGLPFDLTQAEARKIANVVLAMATLPEEQI